MDNWMGLPGTIVSFDILISMCLKKLISKTTTCIENFWTCFEMDAHCIQGGSDILFRDTQK
jgi:hypothetical protein